MTLTNEKTPSIVEVIAEDVKNNYLHPQLVLVDKELWECNVDICYSSSAFHFDIKFYTANHEAAFDKLQTH